MFGHIWVVKLTYRKKLSCMLTLRCQQSDIVPIDTGGKFSASVVDTGGNICHRCHWHRRQICCRYRLHQHLEFWISQGIFKKIWSDPSVISRGLGEDDSRKKPEAKNISWHCPFKIHYRHSSVIANHGTLHFLPSAIYITNSSAMEYSPHTLSFSSVKAFRRCVLTALSLPAVCAPHNEKLVKGARKMMMIIF